MNSPRSIWRQRPAWWMRPQASTVARRDWMYCAVASANAAAGRSPARSRRSHRGVAARIQRPRRHATRTPEKQDTIVAESTLQRISKVDPVYPQRALEQLTSGWVELQFTVATDGTVHDVVVMDSQPRVIFDKSAIAALRRWRTRRSCAMAWPCRSARISACGSPRWTRSAERPAVTAAMRFLVVADDPQFGTWLRHRVEALCEDWGVDTESMDAFERRVTPESMAGYDLLLVVLRFSTDAIAHGAPWLERLRELAGTATVHGHRRRRR